MQSTEVELLARRDRQLALYQSIVDALPFPMFWKDTTLAYMGCNQRFAQNGGATSPAGVIGRNDFDMPWRREESEVFRARDREVLDSGVAKLGIRETVREADGRERWVETHKIPLRDEHGAVVGVLGWYHDITAQHEAMQELATPLLPVADGVLVLPLIGTIDAARARQVMDTLLAGVAEHRAHAAILDVTGVRSIDDAELQALLRVVQGVGLLGAAAVITGVRPAMARTIAGLGADLRGLVMLADLKAGIAHAMARSRGGRR